LGDKPVAWENAGSKLFHLRTLLMSQYHFENEIILIDRASGPSSFRAILLLPVSA
jgi:hypothetical protein